VAQQRIPGQQDPIHQVLQLIHLQLQVIQSAVQPQIIFSAHDLLGALARSAGGTHPFAVVPGGEPAREMATRFAVNIAMYVLCSNYKDDQVHAPFLMRRRRRETP